MIGTGAVGGGDQSEGEETEGEEGEGEGDYTVYECPGLASVTLIFNSFRHKTLTFI